MNNVPSGAAELLRHVETPTATLPANLICFSHLRWDFVYQRPQHLLSRFAADTTVFFIEEPMFSDTDRPHYVFSEKQPGLCVVVPHLPHGLDEAGVNAELANLLDGFVGTKNLNDTAFWYYTPMALSFSAHIKPAVTIFDCMDELSAFKFAPQKLKDLEQELLNRADIVFTGGVSLYEAKKSRHVNIHAFPSSIDFEHFSKARNGIAVPEDQITIKGPSFGFYGVVDERFDIDLLRNAAALRPEWQFVIIGPIVKIDPADLPQAANIHYLGGRDYKQLPAYLKAWDVAFIPFAMNDSTRFISPTKTPEYLAAGKPVISTPIHDVIYPYGDQKLIHIASNAEQFVEAGDQILAEKSDSAPWLERVDRFLQGNSWDQTYRAMKSLILKTIGQRN